VVDVVTIVVNFKRLELVVAYCFW